MSEVLKRLPVDSTAFKGSSPRTSSRARLFIVLEDVSVRKQQRRSIKPRLENLPISPTSWCYHGGLFHKLRGILEQPAIDEITRTVHGDNLCYGFGTRCLENEAELYWEVYPAVRSIFSSKQMSLRRLGPQNNRQSGKGQCVNTRSLLKTKDIRSMQQGKEAQI